MNSIIAARLRRLGANLAALAVGGVAARATWAHIVHVGQKYGESMAAWLPVSIDGMMIAGVILSVDSRMTSGRVNPWARGATWLGGVMSIAAQIESGRERGPVAAGIATVFSITLIVVVEAIAWRTKRSASRVVEVAQQVVADEETRLPVPVSPAVVFSASPDRVVPERVPGTGPMPRRKAVSPLTRDESGAPRVLMDRAPRV